MKEIINTNPHKGKFIVFEGIDGSGKSTRAKLLEKFLKSQGKKVFLTHEPTDNSIAGKKIKKILEKKVKAPSGYQMQKLYITDRKHHLKKEITPALKAGKIVISDRYFLSTFAYGMSQGVSFNQIVKLHHQILGKEFILPDLTIILDLDPKIALLIIKKSRKDFSYFEKLKKLEKIRKNYLVLSRKFPNTILLERKSIKRDLAKIKKIIFQVIKEK